MSDSFTHSEKMSPRWLAELWKLENYCSQSHKNICFIVLGFLGIKVVFRPETIFNCDELDKEATRT